MDGRLVALTPLLPFLNQIFRKQQNSEADRIHLGKCLFTSQSEVIIATIVKNPAGYYPPDLLNDIR